MFKFIHTADLHLDAPLKSLALKDAELSELVGNATRRSLERIVDLCIEENVNALLIAGDLYDGDIRSMKTAAFLVAEMERLNSADIPVFMIRGNHDAESVLTRELEFPENVHVFTGHGGIQELTEHGIAIHGVSFARPQASDSLLPKYRPPVQGLFNIGLLHTSLAGASGHDTYAPCGLNDLREYGYDYWALGHIHIRQVHSENPHVIMPGMPQGRDIGEAGPKTVTLVTVDQGIVSLEERVTSQVEFTRRNVPLDDIDDWRDVLNAVESGISGSEAGPSEHKVLRLQLTGETTLAWRLRRDRDLLLQQVVDIARSKRSIWIEGIVHLQKPPSQNVNGEDPRSELGMLMAKLSDNEAFMARVNKIAKDVIGNLPPELRDIFGETEEEVATRIRQLFNEGLDEVVARIMAGDAEDSP